MQRFRRCSAPARFDNSLFDTLKLTKTRKVFRLWKFDDCKALGRLHLRMKVFDLDDCPKYIALSYMWGDFNDKETVHVNGHQLAVTKTLFDFLSSISMNMHTSIPNDHSQSLAIYEWFWSDQICINQRSTEERGHQVALMGQIYSEPEYVFAWLGHRPRGTKFRRAEEQAYTGTKWYTRPGNPRTEGGFHMLMSGYFSRLWIVQETQLVPPKSIIFWCGDRLYPMTTLESYMKQFEPFMSSPEVSRSPKAILSGRSPYAPGSATQSSLMSSIRKFGHNQCIDRRDKIFGLLSLVEPHRRISVDYTKPLEQIVREAIFKEVCFPDNQFPREMSFAYADIEARFDRLVDTVKIVMGPQSLIEEIKPVLWASMILPIPRQLYQMICGHSRCMERHEGSIPQLWRAIWQRVTRYAITKGQQELARELQRRAELHLPSLCHTRHMLDEDEVFLDGSPKTQEALLQRGFRKLVGYTQRMLDEALVSLEFHIFDAILYHPDEKSLAPMQSHSGHLYGRKHSPWRLSDAEKSSRDLGEVKDTSMEYNSAYLLCTRGLRKELVETGSISHNHSSDDQRFRPSRSIGSLEDFRKHSEGSEEDVAFSSPPWYLHDACGIGRCIFERPPRDAFYGNVWFHGKRTNVSEDDAEVSPSASVRTASSRAERVLRDCLDTRASCGEVCCVKG